jgi:starch synthase
VYAASDFLLMPSRFEPCGLSQLIAQRYGTIPIVARTGGLADTIKDLRENPETGDGLFIREGWDGGIWETLSDAYAGYRNPAALDAARRSAMTKDSSWGPALDEYEALFRRLVGAPASPQ